MNIRCAFCQTPYTLSRVDMLDALQEMDSKKLTHYDAHCPRCRRATQIPRQRMEMFMPRWRDELKQFEAEMKKNPQQEAPLPAPEPVPAVEAPPTPEPKAETSSPMGKKPAAKATPKAAAKPAAKKPATKKATTKKSK